MKKYIWLLLLCGSLSAQTYLNPFRDAYKLRVSKEYDSTATTVILNTGQGAYLPDEAFELVWYNSSKYFHPFDDADAEWIRVGTRSGDTLKSVLRGQNRTTRKNHNLAGYTYRVMPVISENMWLKIDTVLANAGAYQSPTRVEIQDTMNTGSVAMSSVWSFADTAKFNSAVYMATGTGTIIYLNGSSIITALGIPTSARILGGSSGSIPKFYYLVGAGGAAITSSNDTIYVTAGGGGGGDSITAIQSPGGTIAVTNPNGPTVSIDVAVGGLDSSRFGLGSVTNSKLKDGSVTTGKFHADAVAPSATYATTAGGAPPTGSATGGVIIGTFPNNLTIDAGKVTGTMILNSTIGTADLSSTCKSPLAGYADSIFNQSSLLASKLDLTRRAKFSLSGQSVFYDSLRFIAGTYMSIIQSGNTLTFNSTGGAGGVGPYTGLGTSFWADDSTFKIGQPVIPKNGYFSMFDPSNGDLIGSDFTPAILADTFNAIRSTAANANNLSSGTVSMNRLGTSGTRDSTTGLCGDGVYRDRTSSGSGITLYGQAHFDSVEQRLAIYNSYISEGDILGLSIAGIVEGNPKTGDVVRVYAKDDSVIVTRPDSGSGTSGLYVNWWRITTGFAFNPENLTSVALSFWAEGRLQSTPPADSIRLTSITDNSENADHATNSVGKGAFYRVNAGGRPYYEFTGTDTSYMNSDNVSTAATGTQKAYTIFAVLKYDSLVANRNNPFCSFASTIGSSDYTIFPINKGATSVYLRTQNNGWDADSVSFEWTQSSYTLTGTDSDNVYNAWNIIELKFDGDTLFQYWNNMTAKVATEIVADTNAFSRFTIGAFFSQSSSLYTSPAYVNIGGLFVFSGEMSDVDRSYMYTKLDEIYLTAYTP